MTPRALFAPLVLALAAASALAQSPAPAAQPAPANRNYWVEVVLDHELQAWLDNNLNAGAAWRLHSMLPVPAGCLNEPKKARLPCTRVIAERKG